MAAPPQRCRAEPACEAGRLTNRFILVANIEATRRRQGDRRRQRAGHRGAALRRALLLGAGPRRRSRSRRRSSQASPSTKSSARRRSGWSASRGWRASWRRWSAPIPDDAERAARLAKADLITGMVGEFPELQGVMGRYYALAQGEKPAVADAIRDHYKPQGPNDSVPTRAGLGRRGARRQARHAGRLLGDRREADGEQGPYALRRAALGVIRIVLANELRLRVAISVSVRSSYERWHRSDWSTKC